MTNSWQTAIVHKTTRQTPDFLRLILRPKKFYSFKSGNFIELAVERNEAHKEYSVVSTPYDKGIYEVGIKLYKNGALSPKLFKLKEGDKLLMRGPTGAGFIWQPSSRNTVMIAGGSGICPMVSILRQFKPKRGVLKLLFSAKSGSVYYKEELQKLCIAKNVEFTLIQTGKMGRVSKKSLTKLYGSDINSNTDFFVAGPTEFVQNVSLWLYEAGINPNNLKTDDFGAD